jgi:hypothetical protein
LKKLCLFLALIPTLLFSYDEYEAMFDIPADPPPYFPLSLSGSYLQVSRARFTEPTNVEGDKLIYKQFDTAVGYTHPITDCYGLIFGSGWVGTVVDWINNPLFDETDFNYINLSGGIYSDWLDPITLILTAGVFFDTAHFSLMNYTLFQPLVQAKYHATQSLEVDLGVICEIGLDRNEYWPIVGFNYIPENTNWRIHAVYPINIDVEFDVNECLTAAGAIRFLRNRHRVGDDNPLPQAVFQYKSWGGEFNLNYHPYSWVNIMGAVGTTLSGRLRVANRNNEDASVYQFENTLYGAFNAIISF